jgi:hypothetical protein
LASAVGDLGLSQNEFLALMPVEFHAIHCRYRNSLEERYGMVAQLTAAVVNSGFCRPEKTLEWLDFMPTRFRATRVTPEPAKRLTAKAGREIVSAWRNLAKIYGPKS